MESRLSPETQFSIYKINLDAVEEVFHLSKKAEQQGYCEEIISALINSINKIIQEKPNSFLHQIKFQGFCGVIFKTIHDPVWKSVMQQVVQGNELASEKSKPAKDFLTNTNISYVLFYLLDSCIYATTGGYGSNYISKFIEKNYGLHLLPKIVRRDNPILKQIIENNLTGNLASSNRANRTNTSFFVEQDMSSIYRQLSVEIDRNIAQLLGINFTDEEPDNKKVNVINKDSLVIRRAMSLIDLSKLFYKINVLEKKKDNFALNYLVPANKRGLKNIDLFDNLTQALQCKKHGNFLLVGDDFENYYSNANKYTMYDDSNQIVINAYEPITMDSLFNFIDEKNIKLSKGFVQKLLKNWTISTVDNAGTTVLFPLRLIDAMQGFIEFGADKQPCYLFNGSWYVFDPIYDQLLSKEFRELFDMLKPSGDLIKNKFRLIKRTSTEDAYNNELYSEKRIIVAHTVLLNNVEIADAIFWDDLDIYLMHNKGEFSGIGARDLSNQIITASNYLQKKLMSSERHQFIVEYYRLIENKYSKKSIQLDIDEQEFVNAFETKNINFISGYINGYKKLTRSTYSKYLTIELYKKLSAKSYNFIPLGIIV